MLSAHSNAVAAVLVAAGRGVRAGGDVPKQYRSLQGQPAMRPALQLLAGHTGISVVQPVINPADRDLYARVSCGLKLLPAVDGGATRQASVHAGLEALAQHRPAIVLVHDAARPFASRALVSRAIEAAAKAGAAIPALPVTDTVKSVDSDGLVVGTIDRAPLRLIQTPQAFAFDMLLDAHRKAVREGRHDFTDDAALAEWAGVKVSAFPGEAGNIKLTNTEDFLRAERAGMSALTDTRIGQGIDVHAFGPGDHVVLGGVRIAHDRSLTGHSDADVVLHAAVDAILGALADGDIGSHFPPSDAQWRGASSDRFLKFAMDRVSARGGIVAHLDVTVVCEAPRIGPHRDRMRESIAAIAGLDIDRVAVKATTSEKLGFTGRGEGIAAYATATIRLPWDNA